MSTEAMDDDESLCLGICEIDDEAGYCLGCGRPTWQIYGEPPPEPASPILVETLEKPVSGKVDASDD
ncbi:DUF1289 domain-containing protein [Cognatazoarcus halotolerans]|uniref:DUF1289 domain-containing protein n=1 Tax=Cognatazoarcus halotolerans TaxID=2686016 RepID=UPI00135793DD|nr:DUF1289 domain-containing protein [Cognatazoarcus halotolerans]MCB1901078.1 DUF1289 domain-containing protein [Rhodocyclaceae bacterium]MCP5307774.1 DUF1289 domain-containing protein [Zoogloeaceae bacterium]